MNRLPSSASFQGVLDSIIRSYLLNELPPEGAENGRHYVAEKDLGFIQASGLHLNNPPVSATNFQNTSEVNNNSNTPVPGTSANAAANTFTSENPTDHEYIKAVYQCFEKRGVFKELQTFLRHKLVSILQEEWPNLQKPVSASQKEGPNAIVHRLVDDFLRCHKLLYTLSVLASESDVKTQSTRVLYGKLSSKEAEDLLNEMGIKKNSRLSGQILKCYFDKESFSLLESMHYLGVWLDGSSTQLDDLQQDNGETQHVKRRGSAGESIVLRHESRNGKDKLVMEAPLTTENKIDGRDSVLGVEEKLLELQRNLEKEKEFKIKEAIEKYKKEELAKLREELETKFKLQLVEKDREHFLDFQKKMDEVNKELNEERQKFLEVKLRQEKELLEIKNKLSEMMNVSGDGSWKNVTLPTTNGNARSFLQNNSKATKTSQVTFDDTVDKCSCSKRLSSCCATEDEFFPGTQKSATDPIEQDRLAFLQYRMEQQDEEIKSLKLQLLASSQRQLVSKQRASVEDGAAGHTSDNNNKGRKEEHARINGTSDDLAIFLSESRARVEKLDTAVDKVDEIVQELFSKRRSPLANEASSHLLSTTVKKNKPSLSQLYSSLHNMSTTTVPSSVPLLSSMSFPSAVPLVHQQIPEKQSVFRPSTFQNSPSPSVDFDTTSYPHHSGLLEAMLKYRSPPLPASLVKRANKTQNSSPKDLHELNRPETPVDRIFDVAYSEPLPETVQNRTPRKISSPEATTARNSNNNGNGTLKKTNSSEVAKPEESLFHMAIRNNDTESRTSTENSPKTLEETAIRHGALSREKILSSEEGENENSVSISLSVSQNQKAAKPILKPSFNNNVGVQSDTMKAISKSKVSPKFDELPSIRSANGNAMHAEERRQSLSSQQTKPKNNASPLSSSSSSKKSASGGRKAANNAALSNAQVQREVDDEYDNQSSLSISVPKSLDEDNNDDFWQL